MEEKRFDIQTIIGFVLLSVLFIWIVINNRPNEAEIAKQKAQQEQAEAAAANKAKAEAATAAASYQNIPTDSVALAAYKATLGDFAYSATLPSAKNAVTVIENKDLKLTISNKGGIPKEVLLKEFKTYDTLPVYLIKDGNASFAVDFTTIDGKKLNTKNLYFEPSLTTKDGKQVLTMRLKTAENNYLEYVYTLGAEGYMVDVAVRSQGLAKTLNSSAPIAIDWQLKARRMEKSVTYENRYTQATIQYDNGEISRMNQAGNDGL